MRYVGRTLTAVTQTIQDALNNWEPRVKLLKVQVDPLADQNSVNVSIYFYINNVPNPVSVTVNLERIR